MYNYQTPSPPEWNNLSAPVILMSSLLLGGCNELPPPAKSSHAQPQTARSSDLDMTRDDSYKDLLAQLQKRNPEQEAYAAIQTKKQYFLCNAGRSNTVPGLSAEVYIQAQQHCELRCLPGVSDALYGEHHATYLTAALNFSARWNQTMLAACR